ncbi:MAG: glycosyltransferase [Propionibacteriaceae bacterium]|nr:glycosyltransferase [Propionibacteriaceae bacterium]
MRFLLQGFGSRGDVQPMIELGKGLLAAGHDNVAVAAWLDFEPMITKAGLQFEPYHLGQEQLLAAGQVQRWIKATDSETRATRLQGAFLASVAPVIAQDLLRMVQPGDVTINGLLAADPMATLAQHRGATAISALFCPLLPTRSATSFMAPAIPKDSLINKIWSTFAMMVYAGYGDPVAQRVRAELGLKKRTRRDYLRALTRTPTLLAVSPAVAPPAPDWPKTQVQTGWWARRTPADYQPPAELADFLAAGDPPVYLSFGSMSVAAADPAAEARLAVEALTDAGCRGLLDRGLLNHDLGDLPDTVLAISDVPHDWLFPRCAAVVHHGGSGTTGAAMGAGVPALVVPHIGDQMYFARRTHALGCGPAPIRRHELAVTNLSGSIRAMLTNDVMRQRATRLGHNVHAEDGVRSAVRQIEAWLTR